MMAGCNSGDEYKENINEILENAGFSNIKMIPKDNSKLILETWVPDRNIEDFVAKLKIS